MIDNRNTAPTGWHVLVLSSGNPTPARGPESWHRYRAIYGEGYPWREATTAEVAQWLADEAEFMRESGSEPVPVDGVQQSLFGEQG